ncbi:hypothetical protein DBY68_017535 [Pseudocitrobacter sp. RIT415]|nr:hypothetical protein DBY68_017535 [Pseudocitrobacter sp. RIT 415]
MRYLRPGAGYCRRSEHWSIIWLRSIRRWRRNKRGGLLRSRSVQLAAPVVEPRSGLLTPPGCATYEKKARTFVRALSRIWR